MSQLLLQVLSILTEPSGDLIFHLVQIFSALAALLLALSSHQDNKSSIYRRFLLGIMVVLGGQLLLFLITTFGWRGYFDTHLLLPILDRTVNSLCMVWIIWLWVAPLPWKVADYSLIGLNIFIGLSFLVTGFTWFIQGAGMDFNSTWQDLLWADLMVLSIVAGLVGLIFKKPDGWGVGVGFLAINLTGLTAHLVYPMQPGDYVGIVRLVQVFTYPLLPVLTRRFTVLPAPIPAPTPLPIPSGPPERTRFTAESRTIDTWLQLSAQERSDPFNKLLVKAIAQTMVADICLLISAPDVQNQVRVRAGYDLIRQETLGEGSIKGENIPEIVRAFNQNLPLIMQTGGQVSKDLKTFRDVLNLKAPSNSMFIPILYHQEPIAGMLLCSPYSTRVWDITDESYLYSVTNRVGALLAEISKREEDLLSDDLAEMDEEAIRQKYSLLKQENIALVTEIDVLQKNPELPPEPPAPQLELPAVIALPAVTSMANGNKPALNYEEEQSLRNELRIALEEVSRLRTAQAVAVASNTGSETSAQETSGGMETAARMTAIRATLANVRSQIEDGDAKNRVSDRLLVADDLLYLLEEPHPVIEPSEFSACIDDAVIRNRELLAHRNVSLLTDISPDLPPIQSLPSLTLRVISSVFAGILDSSPQGSSIQIKAALDGDLLNLQISHPLDPRTSPDLNFNEDPSFSKNPVGFSKDDWELNNQQMLAIEGNIQVQPLPPVGQLILISFRAAKPV
jgi:hypothetical protein